MNWNRSQQKLIKQLQNPFLFRLYTLFNIPFLFLSGTKLTQLNEKVSVTTAPFWFGNKNPFKSMYFAVQAMVAEFSTAAPAMLALKKHQNSIAIIVVNCEAQFTKKVNQRVYFTCEDYPLFQKEIDRCVTENVPVQVKSKTTGRLKDGTEVATFYFTWSFKKRN